MDHLDRNLGFLLHDVARLMRKRFEQSALADILEVEPITLTRILDRLEEAGLVQRLLHSKDRRVRLLRLTHAAHPLLDEIFAIGALTRGEALEGVPEEDRNRLFDILSSMKANLIG